MKVVNKFLGLKKNNRNAYFFFAVMCVFLIIFLICSILNTCLNGYVFILSEDVFARNISDWFMDFFNVNYFVRNMDPYIGNGSSYPPLALLIAKLFSLCTDYVNNSSLEARSTVGGIISLAVFYAIFYIFSFILLYKICKKKGVSFPATIAFYVGFLISAPMLFAFNRGNYLIFAILACAVFFVYYEDERRWARELSYVALAIAAGIKLYPAAFALILLKNKRFLDFAKVALYSICFVVLPFFAFKGGFVANVKSFLSNLLDWTGTPGLTDMGVTNIYCNNISVKNQFVVLCSKLTGKTPWILPEGVDRAGKALGFIITAILVCVSIMAKENWRSLSAMGLIIALFPSNSFYYSVVFTFIPFVSFIVSEKEEKTKIYYWIFYIIMYCPLSLGYLIQPYENGLWYGYTVMNWLQGLSMIAMAIMHFIETLIEFIKGQKSKHIEKTDKTDKVEI